MIVPGVTACSAAGVESEEVPTVDAPEDPEPEALLSLDLHPARKSAPQIKPEKTAKPAECPRSFIVSKSWVVEGILAEFHDHANINFQKALTFNKTEPCSKDPPRTPPHSKTQALQHIPEIDASPSGHYNIKIPKTSLGTTLHPIPYRC